MTQSRAVESLLSRRLGGPRSFGAGVGVAVAALPWAKLRGGARLAERDPVANKACSALSVVVFIAACSGSPSPHGAAHVCTFFETEFHNCSVDGVRRAALRYVHRRVFGRLLTKEARH